MSQIIGCASPTNSNDRATTTLYLSSLEKEVKDNQIVDDFPAFEEVENVQNDNEQVHSFAIAKFTQSESKAKLLADDHNIAGQGVRIGIDDSESKPLDSGLEASRTSFLDLNDDCFYEILSKKSISIIELCSIAETNSRLRDIANVMFTKRFKNITLKSSVNTIEEARREIVTFGSLTSELWLSSHHGPEKETGIFDLVTKCCSNSLNSLHLYNYNVPECVTVKSTPIFSNLQKLDIKNCTIEGASKDLFGGCESLVELDLDGHDEDMIFIFDNAFPQLTRCNLKRKRVDSILKNFISGQIKLKSLKIWTYDDCSYLLPIIAGNCKQLEELHVGSNSGDSLRFENALSSLLTLKHLTKLHIDCHSANLTKFIQELSALKSLKDLKLFMVRGYPEFLPALSQLKQLQILRFDSEQSEYFQELNLLSQLENLTELSIYVGTFTDVGLDVDIDIVSLVEHLTKLRYLQVFIRTFKLNKKKYLKILKILRQRVVSPQQTLEIKCLTVKDISKDLQHNNRSIIKLN